MAKEVSLLIPDCHHDCHVVLGVIIIIIIITVLVTAKPLATPGMAKEAGPQELLGLL